MDKQAGKVSDWTISKLQKLLEASHGLGRVGGAVRSTIKGGFREIRLGARHGAGELGVKGRLRTGPRSAQEKKEVLKNLWIRKGTRAVSEYGPLAGAAAAGGAGAYGLGSLISGGGKKKMEKKGSFEFRTPEFAGFFAELTKNAGYKADKEAGEGAGKAKSSKAAAAPTPVGGTKNPKSNSAGPKPVGKGGAAHKADEDDAEGYE